MKHKILLEITEDAQDYYICRVWGYEHYPDNKKAMTVGCGSTAAGSISSFISCNSTHRDFKKIFK